MILQIFQNLYIFFALMYIDFLIKNFFILLIVATIALESMQILAIMVKE